MRAFIFNILIVILLGSFGLQAQDNAVRTITVSGESEISVVPDRLSFSISLYNNNDDIKEAKSDNDVKLEKVKDVLKLFGLDNDDIEVSSFDISPVYKDQYNFDKIESYKVSRSLKITLDDLDIYDQLIEALINAEIDRFSQARYIYSEREQAAKQARLKALEKARQKATEMTQALDLKLGRVLKIGEGEFEYNPFDHAFGSANVVMDAFDTLDDSDNIKGKVKVRAYVKVTFELVD
jgi:hypothetical protein